MITTSHLLNYFVYVLPLMACQLSYFLGSAACLCFWCAALVRDILTCLIYPYLLGQSLLIFSIIVPIVVIFALPALSFLLLSMFQISPTSKVYPINITQFSSRPTHPSSCLSCTCPNRCTSACTLSISCVQPYALFQDRSCCDQVVQRRPKPWLPRFS